jgi:hypothetical protein
MMNQLCVEEASLDEVLKDAATRLLMRSDGVSESDIRGLLRRVADGLSRRKPRARAVHASRRWMSPTWLAGLFTLAIIGVPAAYEASQSPAEAIRGALTTTAIEIVRPASSHPSKAQLASIERHFPGDATVDASSWPRVAVTLRHLSQATCERVLDTAQRIEGLVVIELQHYRSAVECGSDNEMTWRITP